MLAIVYTSCLSGAGYYGCQYPRRWRGHSTLVQLRRELNRSDSFPFGLSLQLVVHVFYSSDLLIDNLDHENATDQEDAWPHSSPILVGWQLDSSGSNRTHYLIIKTNATSGVAVLVLFTAVRCGQLQKIHQFYRNPSTVVCQQCYMEVRRLYWRCHVCYLWKSGRI